jgi:HAD superfamily hydrolase (TIGR01509 family)
LIWPRMKPPQAVIFDMDGVIVNSEACHERAFWEVVNELGYGPSYSLDFSAYVGRSDRALWLDFIALKRPSQDLGELLAMKTRRVVEFVRRERPLFSGLMELVEKLAAEFPLGLASGSDRTIVDEVLKLENLGRFFSAVVSDSEVPKGKPAPDIFLRAAELLGVVPGVCWVIEDSKPGITAGLAAGMRVIAITNTHGAEELSHATHVVGGYAEIERLLLGRV